MIAKRRRSAFFLLLIPLIGAAFSTSAQSWDPVLQVSAWGTAQEEGNWQLVSRIQPGVGLEFPAAIPGNWDARVDYVLNGYKDRYDQDFSREFYRWWIRLSGAQYELRAGLQKINFGPGFLLRPLMWFDGLDPRDPLQITRGVKGLLGRYYFLNNANLWAWMLYDNTEPHGWDILDGHPRKPEWGGRLQFPAIGGELGFSANRRYVRFNPLGELFIEYPEYKFGIDGRWDVVVGLWFEAVTARQDLQTLLPLADPYQQFLMGGTDYTFPLGNGLHLLGEHMAVSLSRDFSLWDNPFQVSAVSVDYPVGLLDRVSLFVLRNWDADNWTLYGNWTTTTDRWQLVTSLFRYPRSSTVAFVPGGSTTRNNYGFGGRLMLILNL
ncbi:MAG TPA: hypothetical protein PKV71_12045 [Calditrichia bacterium]|nr:hypothetical protein [Calditrichota bacterium]HQU73885.1 hypothetical protein [Calditrichia bacterium]HQV32605.1 hypothetical protein [Calditrichia bacterium]